MSNHIGFDNVSIFLLQKASSGSVVSLNKLKKEKRSKSHSVSREENLGGSMLVHAPSNFDLTKTFTKNSYFSDINPKNLRRLKNIVAVTGKEKMFS